MFLTLSLLYISHYNMVFTPKRWPIRPVLTLTGFPILDLYSIPALHHIVFPFPCFISFLSYCRMTCGPGMLSSSSWCLSFLSDHVSSEGNFDVALLPLSLSPIFVLEKHLIFSIPPAMCSIPWIQHSFLVGIDRLLTFGTKCSIAFISLDSLHARYMHVLPSSAPTCMDWCRSIPFTRFLIFAPWTTSCSLIIISTKFSGTSFSYLEIVSSPVVETWQLPAICHIAGSVPQPNSHPSSYLASSTHLLYTAVLFPYQSPQWSSHLSHFSQEKPHLWGQF